MIQNFFNTLQLEDSNFQADSADLMFHQLSAFLIHISRLRSENGGTGKPGAGRSIADSFKNLVRNNLTKGGTVTSYARQLHMTPKHLTSAIKKEEGRSAKQLMQEIILLEAKTLLLQTDLPVADIAFRLGFRDASHFNKMFKTLTRITPTTFRKKG